MMADRDDAQTKRMQNQYTQLTAPKTCIELQQEGEVNQAVQVIATNESRQLQLTAKARFFKEMEE